MWSSAVGQPLARPYRAHATFTVAWVLVAVPNAVAQFQKKPCSHCATEEPFKDLFKADDPAAYQQAHSMVHFLWPTHIEVVHTTSDIDGWEDPELHKALAAEAIRAYADFESNLDSKLPKGHEAWERAKQAIGDPYAVPSTGDLFHEWQQSIYKSKGDVEMAMRRLDTKTRKNSALPDSRSNTTWPEMEALPQYARVRKVVDRLSRRYLERSGVVASTTQSVNYSIFSWAGVYSPQEFRMPRSYPGEYLTAVFVAKAGPWSGKIRLSDPRGHSDPFGKEFYHVPRSGDLLLFPSWLSQMTTPPEQPKKSAPADAGVDRVGEKSVFFYFNVRPEKGPLPPQEWWMDPLNDIRISRPAFIGQELFQGS